VLALWARVSPRYDLARASFEARWQLHDGPRLRFDCLVSTWSDFDATYAFDWLPADGATASWLAERSDR